MKKKIVTEYSDEELKEVLKEVIISIFKEFEVFKPPDITSEVKSVSTKYLTRKDVAKTLSLSYPTIIKLHKNGKLKGTLIGGTYRYSLQQIQTFFNGSRRTLGNRI